jgi:hypothetical protein
MLGVNAAAGGQLSWYVLLEQLFGQLVKEHTPAELTISGTLDVAVTSCSPHTHDMLDVVVLLVVATRCRVVDVMSMTMALAAQHAVTVTTLTRPCCPRPVLSQWLVPVLVRWW